MFFEQSFHMGSARIDFNNRKLVDTLLSLSFSDYDTNVTVKGLIDAVTGKFKYQLFVDQMDSKKWAPYLFPVKAFRVSTLSV